MIQTFNHDVCGVVKVEHRSNTVEIEFERLEIGDLILPQYRTQISMEHILGWVESMLTERTRKCKRFANDQGSGKRLQAMLRLTERDPQLIFTSFSKSHLILVRDGRVLKVPFALEPMETFMARLKEDGGDQTRCCAEALANFVWELMVPS